MGPYGFGFEASDPLRDRIHGRRHRRLGIVPPVTSSVSIPPEQIPGKRTRG